MKSKSFLKGAFILVFASFLVKIMGFLYQILIVRIIGLEGIGIFNMIIPLYIMALVLITMGLPLAISKFIAEELVSQQDGAAEKILKITITILLLTSTLVSLSLIIFAPFLIKMLYTDPRIIPSFLILTPSLLLAAISSAIRGYFQGCQDMRPTAYTQLIEQIVRVFSGLLLVYFLSPYGLVWSSIGLAIAIVCSELAGFFYL